MTAIVGSTHQPRVHLENDQLYFEGLGTTNDQIIAVFLWTKLPNGKDYFQIWGADSYRGNRLVN